MQTTGGVLVWLCLLLSPALTKHSESEEDKKHIAISTLIEHDPGESGAKCTKQGRRCISGADCVQRQCVCPPSLPKGDALIACVREDEIVCIASLDPYVVAFGGARAKPTLPCRHRLSYFVTPNTADNPLSPFCAFEVFGLTSITDYGVFYQLGFDLTISLGDIHGADFVSVHIKKLGLVQDDLYQYLVSADHSSSPLGGAIHEEWNGVTVECYFDPGDNFAVVWVPQCHTALLFRPFNYSRDNPVQTLKPGIVIQAPANATFERHFGGFPGSLCGHPQDDPDIFSDLAQDRRLRGTTTALTYEMLIVGVTQHGGDYDQECTDAQEIIAHCWKREEAVNLCNRILAHRSTLRCLLDQEINVMQTFTHCLQFYCFSDSQACHLFTDHLSHCPRTHRFLSDIQCPAQQRTE